MRSGMAERCPVLRGCNGCSDFCGPVNSDRFLDGLTFRPCTLPYQFGAIGHFSTDVPFAAAPADSYRITAVGGPTTPGAPDEAQVGDARLGPEDASATTAWQGVDLSGDPFLPTRTQPVIWSVGAERTNSYDVAAFTVSTGTTCLPGEPRPHSQRRLPG